MTQQQLVPLEPLSVQQQQQHQNLTQYLESNDKCEVPLSCRKLPLNEHPINEDNCPEVIHKSGPIIEQTQDVYIRYLKPVAPEPGPIIYKYELNKHTCPAPPLVIQQRPESPCAPMPLVIRVIKFLIIKLL